jgi:hypothetical protein
MSNPGDVGLWLDTSILANGQRSEEEEGSQLSQVYLSIGIHGSSSFFFQYPLQKISHSRTAIPSHVHPAAFDASFGTKP